MLWIAVRLYFSPILCKYYQVFVLKAVQRNVTTKYKSVAIEHEHIQDINVSTTFSISRAYIKLKVQIL